MGNDYSRMQGTQFPPGYFCIGFRQPDSIQVVHAAPEIINLVKHSLQESWGRHGGIKSEKRYSLGIELRLGHDPIGHESNDLAKVSQCFQMVAQLLQDLLNNGCVLLTAGHYIRSIERNIWILSRNDISGNASCLAKYEVAAIGMEDWNRIFMVNAPIDAFQSVQQDIEALWSLGMSKVTFVKNVGTIELGGQPWDSYKGESEKTPLMVIRMVDVMSQNGYRLITSTHIRGVIDTLLFVKDPAVAKSSQKFMMMGLNQQDQLRFYNSCSEVVNGISKMVKNKWEKGILGDEFASIMWVLRLKGSPWWVADWDKDAAMAARSLVTQILHELRTMGWKIVQTLELYRSQYDKSFFLLEKDMSAACAVPHFSITSHDIDRLCIADAPEDLQAVIQEEVKAHWTHSIKEDANTAGYLEFSLSGKPWLWDYENCALNLEAMGILCWVIEIIQARGWELIASADICSNTKYSPHTLVFALKSKETSSSTTIKDS